MVVNRWEYNMGKWELTIVTLASPADACAIERSVHVGDSFRSEDFVRLFARCGPGFIDRVIFNPPATIVFWKDGTKTVVKAENEPFDAEKGFAMAVAKKFLTSKDYHRIMASANDYRESVCVDNAGQTRRKDE